MDGKFVLAVVLVTMALTGVMAWDALTDAAVLQDVLVYGAGVVLATVAFTGYLAHREFKNKTQPVSKKIRRRY